MLAETVATVGNLALLRVARNARAERDPNYLWSQDMHGRRSPASPHATSALTCDVISSEPLRVPNDGHLDANLSDASLT